MGEKMIKAYFGQSDQYYSESQEKFLQVSEMNQAHAANAVSRLMADSMIWANDAGEKTLSGSRAKAWMVRQPLFLALVMRANQR
jgi:hypothetical protein